MNLVIKSTKYFLFYLIVWNCISCSKGGGSSNLTPAITITSLSATHGGFTTQITVTGTGFDQNTKFYFNGKLASTAYSTTATQATLIVPLAAGTGVVTANVNGTIVTGPNFTYDKVLCVSTLAGDGDFGFIDGNGISARFNQPFGIAMDKSGNLYIADTQNNRIRKVTIDGIVTTYAGNGTAGTTDGAALSASFNSPKALAFDATGNLYVIGDNMASVRKITVAGIVSSLAPPSATTYDDPEGIVVDQNGNIYIADTGHSVIKKITSAGVVTTFAGDGTFGYKDGQGTSASFEYPSGITIDAVGNLFVTDKAAQSVRKITSTGTVSTLKTTGTSLGYPQGFVIDNNGDFYIADGGGRAIQKISNGVISLYAGSTIDLIVKDGPVNKAVLGYPTGIVTDNAGTFYYVDSFTNKIKKLAVQ